MTFEEDFPSLKDIGGSCLLYEYVDKENIIKYCLDKQKVKDAINKCIEHKGSNVYDCMHCELLDILGIK